MIDRDQCHPKQAAWVALIKGVPHGQNDFQHLRIRHNAFRYLQPARHHLGRCDQQDNGHRRPCGDLRCRWREHALDDHQFRSRQWHPLQSFRHQSGYSVPTVTSALVINASGGVIAGQNYGIITDGATTITNQSGGTLSANGNDIVFLQTVGTIFYGVATNALGSGLYLQGGGTVVNGATGTISVSTSGSGIGVRLNAVGTVTNAGTIIGGTGGAVFFETISTANDLIVDPGAVFQGGINGGNGSLNLVSNGTAGYWAPFPPAVLRISAPWRSTPAPLNRVGRSRAIPVPAVSAPSPSPDSPVPTRSTWWVSPPRARPSAPTRWC